MISGLFRFLQKRALQIPAIILLIVGPMLTGLACYYAYYFKQSEFDRKLGQIAAQVSTAVEVRLSSYGHLLVDTRSFIEASSFNSQSFSRFVGSLDLDSTYPSMSRLGYIPAEEATLESAERQSALDLARDTGEPSLSSRLNSQSEYLMAVPVYDSDLPLKSVRERRAALRGYVYGLFNAHSLLNQVAQENKDHLSGVNMAVYDGGAEAADRQLFVHKSEEPGSRQRPQFIVHRNWDNHEWTLVVSARPDAFGGNGLWEVVWIALLGSLASLMIYFYARWARLYSASLEKSQGFMKVITNALPSLVAYVDHQHRYIYNNRTYFDWWGKKPSDLYLQPVSEFLGPAYENYFRPLIDRALKGEHISFEYSLSLQEDGSGRRFLRGEYIPDVAADGRINGVVVVVDDQTEQKLAQDKLKDERRITELVNEVGMTLQAELNTDRLAQKITDVATELTGAEVGAFIYNMKLEAFEGGGMMYTISGPMRDNVVLSQTDPRMMASSFQDEHIVRLDDVTTLYEFDRLCPNFAIRSGSRTMRSYLAAPVVARSGQVLGGLVFAHTRPGVFSDRAEKLIAGIAAQAAVALDNAKLYSEAQSINRVKDEFLATLSHELRTPMNVVLGYSELLKEENLSEDVRSYVDAIYRNACTQNQLIADLLDISAIITGKLGFQPTRMNVGEVMRAALDNIRFAAESKGVRLESRVPANACPIIGDPTRVQQIVWNLLSNAVKFTPKGGQVEVELMREGNRCHIKVRDTGIGIDPEFLPYVFERFSQEDSGRSRRFGGLGLGLSIVRQLVELHGGHIRVESEGKNRGALFTVILPAAEASESVNTVELQ